MISRPQVQQFLTSEAGEKVRAISLLPGNFYIEVVNGVFGFIWVRLSPGYL